MADTNQGGIVDKIKDALSGNADTTSTTSSTSGAGTSSALATGSAYGRIDGREVTREQYESLAEADRLRVQLIQEELHVDKDVRQVGEVEVSKRVVEEQVQVPVTLQHEEVVITRRAVDQAVDASVAGTVFQDETIRVPVHEEVAHVTKEARVAEEIEIEKRSVGQQQTVTETVRHEELDVQGQPQNRVHVEGNANTNI